jgi:propanol-preferring alcohol dehydrogenase
MVRHRFPGVGVYVFARNERERGFARELGAVWTGDIQDRPPRLLDAVIDTTPVWRPVVESLRNLGPGGRLVINAIRKEETDKRVLLDMKYELHLWEEKEIKSVANVTRQDVEEFLGLAAGMHISPETEEYPLKDANVALNDLHIGRIRGAKVLRM